MKFNISILYFLLSLLSFQLFSQEIENKINIKIIPDRVYIEKGEFATFINFDLLVENLSDDTLNITEILLHSYDNKNKLICRKMINDNGFNPSINTIGKTTLDKKESLYIYNPFFQFDLAQDIDRLHYVFQFLSNKGEQFTSEIEVTPINYTTKTDLILPIKDRVLIYDGHDFYSHHRRIDLINPILKTIGITANPSRYGYDFCVVNKDGDLFKGDKKINENWYGYGVPVYAPGAGKIVELVNTTSDNIIGEREFDFNLVFENPKIMAGNYIIIDHLNGEYSMLAHLKEGTFKVKEGDMIKQGQILGEMGFSGSTGWWVHLHYELRNGKDMWTNEGIPSYFSNFNKIYGDKIIKIKKGQVDTGDILESTVK